MGKLGAVCLLTGYLGGSARVVILECSLVAESVGYFLVTGGVAVNRVGGLVTASIGFLNEVVTRIVTCHTVIVGIELERAVDRTEATVGEGGFGQRVAELVLCLVEGREVPPTVSSLKGKKASLNFKCSQNVYILQAACWYCE